MTFIPHRDIRIDKFVVPVMHRMHHDLYCSVGKKVFHAAGRLLYPVGPPHGIERKILHQILVRTEHIGGMNRKFLNRTVIEMFICIIN